MSRRIPARPILPLFLALGLAACATPEVEGPDALKAKDVAAAVSLYGPWAEQIQVKGRPVYIWRRQAEIEGQTYYCELRVEMGFRQMIARSMTVGYPAACALFNVRYETKLH